MRLLLDTHIIIWALSEPDRLSGEAKSLIQDASEVFVSSASVWEMSIKSGLGKLEVDLDEMLGELSSMGVSELPVLWKHASVVEQLPHHHRDPFDRLLIAQAMEEPLVLITHDKILGEYTDLVRVV